MTGTPPRPEEVPDDLQPLKAVLSALSDPCWLLDPPASGVPRRAAWANPAARHLSAPPGTAQGHPTVAPWSNADRAVLERALTERRSTPRNSAPSDSAPSDSAPSDSSPQGTTEHSQHSDAAAQGETARFPLPGGGTLLSVTLPQGRTWLCWQRSDTGTQLLALSTANERLSSFNASVAHDLGAPVRQIAGITDLLRSELERSFRLEQTERSRAYLELIEQSAERAATLVRDLLHFAQRPAITLQQDVDLGALLHEELEALRAEWCPGGRALEAEWQVHVGPMPTVQADPGLLSVVLCNLLSNAVKYSRERSPGVITVTARRQDTDVVVSVHDNGVGFDGRHAGKLFMPLQRLHGSAYPGSGLGLATVRQIVTRHGGRVWAESSPGQGATFHFTLPRQGPTP